MFAQNTGSLRGFVSDSLNGEAVVYANIVVKDVGRGTSTDKDGYYYLPAIPEGNRIVIISFIGYLSKEINVVIKRNSITELNVKLTPTSVELDELQVIADKTVRQNETDLGFERITTRDIEYIPSGAEQDIFKAIQTSPGVSSTGDVTARYFVRGGAGDQNEVLINGVPIYNPFHALGLFSVVDPEVISVVEFNKGGFEPRYGNRLSSIMNVVTRDGNKNKFEASGQASLLAAKASIEGPIPDGSFIATARKSYYSKILKRYLDSEVPVDFYDLSLKANYSSPDLDKGSKFIVHGFYSSDIIDNDDPFKEDYKVSNLLFGANWRKVWSSPLFSYVTLSYSGYDASVDPNFSEAKRRENKLTDISLNADFTYVYESKDELQFGVHNKYLSTDLNQENISDNVVKFNQTGFDLSFYFNYKFYRWDYIGLDIGIRSILLGLAKNRPFILEPRFAFTYLPNPIIAFKIAVGWYSQQISTLTNENEIISLYDPWVIIPDYLNSSHAMHVITGIKTYLSENFTIEAETYYKDFSDLFDINENKYGANFNDYTGVEGEAYGIDVLVQYQYSPVYFKSSYSLSWSHLFKNGEKYFPRYDKRHSFNALIGLNLGAGWDVSAIWYFSTGMPFTPIVGFYDRLQNEDNPPYYFTDTFIPSTLTGERNSERLPVYHRLDLSVSKDYDLELFSGSLGASIVNVYDKENIFYFDKETGESVSMLRFMPSVFVKVKL